MLPQIDATVMMKVTKKISNSANLNEWCLKTDTRFTANSIIANWINCYEKINEIPEKFHIFDFLQKEVPQP